MSHKSLKKLTSIQNVKESPEDKWEEKVSRKNEMFSCSNTAVVLFYKTSERNKN